MKEVYRQHINGLLKIGFLDKVSNNRKLILISTIVLLISIIFFWDKLEEKYFFLAYKEKCLISLKFEKKISSLNMANVVCGCMVDKLNQNQIKLNTSKLQASKIIKLENGKEGPIDQILFIDQCVDENKLNG